jgi:hypothetical protein
MAFLCKRSIYKQICWRHISNCNLCCHIWGNIEHGKHQGQQWFGFPTERHVTLCRLPTFALRPMSLVFPQRFIVETAMLQSSALRTACLSNGHDYTRQGSRPVIGVQWIVYITQSESNQGLAWKFIVTQLLNTLTVFIETKRSFTC